MKVRIGVAESDKIVELEIDDVDAFKKSVASAVESGDMSWFKDTKGREVGIPAARLAYVEVEGEADGRAVGFAPAV